MFFRKKLWLGISATLVTSAAITGCDMQSQDHAPSVHKTMAANAEGGEGGEGGGGEDLAKTIAENDSAYLTHLALIRGHLNVGVDLYRSGARETAATHMKHPEDELYTDLSAGFEARKATGFGEQLSTLAKVVEARGPIVDVDAAYEDLLRTITAAESAAGEVQPQTLGMVIVDLVRTAAEEYDIAVDDDGEVVNGHEYQDALGFVRVAREMTAALAENTDNGEAAEEIRGQLDALISAWPSLVPPKNVSVEPSTLYGAAAHIEFAVLGL